MVVCPPVSSEGRSTYCDEKPSTRGLAGSQKAQWEKTIDLGLLTKNLNNHHLAPPYDLGTACLTVGLFDDDCDDELDNDALIGS